MKKIFTLTLGVFLTAMLFAADRRPVVKLKSAKNFEVVIDGRSYFSHNGVMDIPYVFAGRHAIQVYEVRRGLFGRTAKRLVDSENFVLGRNDLTITVNRQGNVKIKEKMINQFDRDRRTDRNRRF
jgi:hypothetical protein